MQFSRHRDAWELKLTKKGRFAIWAEPMWLRNRKGEGAFGFQIRTRGMSIYFGKNLWVARWGKM